MADDLTEILAAQGPTTGRPFAGLTVLVVEDSRYASEAVRNADRALTAKEATLLATGEGKFDNNGRVVLTTDPAGDLWSSMSIFAPQYTTFTK